MTDRPPLPQLPSIMVEGAVRAALLEDLGRAGDITSAATIDPGAQATARIVSRQDGFLCGMPMARMAFQLMDPTIRIESAFGDGKILAPGAELARVAGPAQAILSAERTALNYLMHLSGVASHTARFAAQIAGTGARICCTRKTIPGMRVFQKYAVRIGGGSNHRFGLDDAILIKDNHIAIAGGVARAIEKARAAAGHLVAVEVEVDTLDQLGEALAAKPDVILLDNMSTQSLGKAVQMNRDAGSFCRLEASGNVDFDTVRAIAETGVDYISTSKITMAAPTLDIGLDISIEA
ncbi:carboxylating nicotinate-nucleotide diphosphorylase [Pararhizobium haloflavum]|uniref:carboxylating nicotinate-nucleotide diphosphorylase n=1 Tax=Pararhizobium haloflavum TaxID=2037914 RepID=UPI00351F8D76